ncbi:MAG: iron-containing alcohol dehydrogenase family protein [Actinomycetota bacterium]|nr:iron-containing alcohol dehydrogenase family protein [Actinomycetota bacterium]
MLTAPLVVDIRRGAVADLGVLLADRRIATEGRVAVAVGPGQGDGVVADLHMETAKVFRVEDGSVDAAIALGKQLRADAYEAVAGIGGGKILDVTKFAAHMAGIAMVAVATNLAHDGLASPVSSLEHESGKGSYGVVPPVAVVVDLDRVRAGPPRMVRAGIGDVVNNLSAIADWELAAADRGEPIDGLAVTLARTAAQAVLHQPGTVADDEFLTVLAESLVLSGIAMTVAGSSRPASGGDHEIVYAIDRLFPGAGTHGELAGLGALFCTYLRGDERLFPLMSACLRRHKLPRIPADLGLGPAEFTQAVLHAPAIRPGRYTILERLDLDEQAIAEQVAGFTAAVGRTGPGPGAGTDAGTGAGTGGA